MKRIIFVTALIVSSSLATAQDYLDVLKYSYNKATMGNEINANETDVSNTNVEFYFPLPVTGKTTIISGFTYENTRLSLDYSDDRSNLIMTRLNLGIKYNHGNGWSGTYVALPKFASDFEGLGSEDFQIGGLALLEKKYTGKYGLKFGTYVSSENFGTTVTPLVGLWYKSQNNKFYINATLPIRADINYSLTDKFSLGGNLLTSIKSYNLAETNSQRYVQEESIRFALFAAYGFWNNALVARAKVGFDTTDYGLYAQGDKVGVQLLTAQLSGDKRERLNSEFSSAAFVGLDLIYRTSL